MIDKAAAVPTRPPFSQRALFANILGLALLLKALVPAGWMPVFDNGIVTLRLCGGWAPAPEAERPAEAHHIAEHGAPAAAADHDRHDSEPSGSDQPCSFAAAAFAWTESDSAFAPRAPPPASLRVGTFSPSVSVGRGLAATPTPSTGPPVLS